MILQGLTIKDYRNIYIWSPQTKKENEEVEEEEEKGNEFGKSGTSISTKSTVQTVEERKKEKEISKSILLFNIHILLNWLHKS